MAKRRRKAKVKKISVASRLSEARTIECECGATKETYNDIVGFTCWECVKESIEPPVVKVIKKSGRPQGWAFMNEFVDKDGNVFHKGKEQPKLKGTLLPTVIKKKTKKRLTKKEKERRSFELSSQMGKLKKQLKRAKFKKDKKPIERDIRKIQRELKKL